MKKKLLKLTCLAMTLCLLLTACIAQNNEVTFNTDGSGTISQRLLYSDALIEFLGGESEAFEEYANLPLITRITDTINGEAYSGYEMNYTFQNNLFLADSVGMGDEPSTVTSYVEDGYDKVAINLVIPALGDATDDESAAMLADCVFFDLALSLPGGIESVDGDKNLYSIGSDGVLRVSATLDENTYSLEIVGVLGKASDTVDTSTFVPVRTYAAQFSDVASGAWYENALSTAYGLGIINGTTDTTFDPNGDLTLAQIIVMACRIHSLYKGDGETFAMATGDQWYTPYVNYAMVNGIFVNLDVEDYNASATRAEMAYVIANTLPQSMYPTIVDDVTIEDMTQEDDFYSYIEMLYSAGIVTGTGSGFAPENNVSRAEAAVFIARLVDLDQRIAG